MIDRRKQCVKYSSIVGYHKWHQPIIREKTDNILVHNNGNDLTSNVIEISKVTKENENNKNI